MTAPEDALVRRTAALARLEITDEEARTLGPQFARILEQFRTLSALDVEGLAPMTGPSRLVDVRRADVPRPCTPAADLLANAPRREGDFYAVPKTVGDEG